jgi:AbrB family looped-hinge helix DNA binding protein
MRITSKGQVTIPVHLREKAGLLPHTEVEFAEDRDGGVRLFRAKKTSQARPPKRPSRGEQLVAQLIEAGRRHPPKMTTDEIMALTRGED